MQTVQLGEERMLSEAEGGVCRNLERGIGAGLLWPAFLGAVQGTEFCSAAALVFLMPDIPALLQGLLLPHSQSSSVDITWSDSLTKCLREPRSMGAESPW